MNAHGGLRKRALGTLVTGLASASLLIAGTASAVTTPTEDTAAFAAAVGGVSSSFLFDYDCLADDPSTIELNDPLCPQGVSDTPLAGFPTSGTTYGVLTTGNAGYADRADDSEGTTYAWGREFATEIGSKVYDAQVAGVSLGAATGNCLAFDFRFFSEEYIEYVDAGYNDAFIAQLDTANVHTDPITQTVNAPGNFAGGVGDVISVDSGGPSAMVEAHNPGADIGTTYDGATPRLVARVPVAPGSVHTVFLTLFDQGDPLLDSAVFVDNFRYETLDATKCKSLAVDPFEGTPGVTPVAGSKPKLAKDLKSITIPVTCNLPPGSPINCTVSGVSAFTPTPGRNATTVTERRASTVVAKGGGTVAADTTGNITLKTTKKGIAALKAAIKKPAKLRAKAKALLAQAKILRSQGKIAEAKLLEAKAAVLIKRAKKLARKPLGVLKTTFTNASNGASQTFKAYLKRP